MMDEYEDGYSEEIPESELEKLHSYINNLQVYIGLEYDLTEQDKSEIAGIDGLIDQIIAPAFFEGEPLSNLAGILVNDLRSSKKD